MTSMTPVILVVTGASGSGKTAAVSVLAARELPGVRCYHFDSVGVPSAEEMNRDFGSGEQWQAFMTQQWLDKFATDPDGAEVYVLDGQTRPTFVLMAAEIARLDTVRVILLDCEPSVRNRRLIELRGQSELANSRMDCWAAYLRGQADALDLPVIDTSSQDIEAVADTLVAHVEQARAAMLLLRKH